MATLFALQWARIAGLLAQDTGKPTHEEPGDPVVDFRFDALKPSERYVHRDSLYGELALQDLQERFAERGITDFSAFEALHLPKHRIAGTIAIPTWSVTQNLVRTFSWAQALRNRCGFALSARGYRPPAYNRAVGGARKSRHLEGQAVDLRAVIGGLSVYEIQARRWRLASEAAILWNEEGKRLKMGLGVYPLVGEQPSHVHVDFGHRARLWADGYAWVQRVRKAQRGEAA